MAGNGADFHEVQVGVLEKAAGGLVPQIALPVFAPEAAVGLTGGFVALAAVDDFNVWAVLADLERKFPSRLRMLLTMLSLTGRSALSPYKRSLLGISDSSGLLSFQVSVPIQMVTANLTGAPPA